MKLYWFIPVTCLVFAIIFCMFTAGCGKKIVEELSPDKSLKLKAYSNEGFVYIEILNLRGDLLYKINTRASAYHRWGVEWVATNKILLKSSDMGDYYWINISENEWQKQPANIAFSPDKKLLVAAIWESFPDKIVKLEIEKPYPDYHIHQTVTVLTTIGTDVKVTNLAGCVSWPEPDLIGVKGDAGTFYWKRQESGNWQMVTIH